MGDHDEYLRLAELEIKGEATLDEVRWLEDNPRLWRVGLAQLKRSLDLQFATRKSDHMTRLKQSRGYLDTQEAHADYNSWRASALHFQRRVEAKMAVVKERVVALNDAEDHGPQMSSSSDDRVGLWAATIAASMAGDLSLSPVVIAERAVAIADAIDDLLQEGREE